MLGEGDAFNKGAWLPVVQLIGAQSDVFAGEVGMVQKRLDLIRRERGRKDVAGKRWEFSLQTARGEAVGGPADRNSGGDRQVVIMGFWPVGV